MNLTTNINFNSIIEKLSRRTIFPTFRKRKYASLMIASNIFGEEPQEQKQFLDVHFKKINGDVIEYYPIYFKITWHEFIITYPEKIEDTGLISYYELRYPYDKNTYLITCGIKSVKKYKPSIK